MRRERENNLKREEYRGWRENRETERGGEREKKRKTKKRKNMKLKFTLTDYISDELARHVPKKSADESTTIRKQKFYKIVFKREREVISKMK